MAGPLLDVLEARKPLRRPIWLMRQAGRYLPEYRQVRIQAGSFLDLCYAPALAAEVTLQPLKRYDFDAAILFSDILVVPHAMGLDLKFVENEGPQLATVTSAADVAALKMDSKAVQFERVWETVARVRRDLVPSKTLIGFCGAPWTVATYMIEGRGSKRQAALELAAENPPWFSDLMGRLVEVSIGYLIGQIEAGAEAVQIFDSWAGDVPVALRERVVVEPIGAIVRGVRARHPNFPVIVFARGVGDGHAEIAGMTGANAVGVEQGISIANVIRALPDGVAAQGNLEPEILLHPGERLRMAIGSVLDRAPKERHIFNLGHGILQQTNPDSVTELVETVRTFDGANA
jgi:uroporphyrinogen decarboxylase